MMKITTICTFAVAAALLSGCISLGTPDGYAERDYKGRYDYLAISTDASAIAVREFTNEDKKKGNLAYWSDAAKKHMTLSRGYEFVEEGSFSSDEGKGKWMLFNRKYRGVEYLYVLGIVVDGRSLYALEAGGEKDVFEKDLPKVKRAFATLD